MITSYPSSDDENAIISQALVMAIAVTPIASKVIPTALAFFTILNRSISAAT